MDATGREYCGTIILISERFGHIGGGEAIKAQQYADFLIQHGYDLKVITAERSKTELGAAIPDHMLWLVPDTNFQKFLWRTPLLKYLLGLYFQIEAKKIVLEIAGTAGAFVLHYISPVSPVSPRFPPKGHCVVIGPLTGNISYPPGFLHRMSVISRIRRSLHGMAQIVLGRVLGDKKKADVLLVSGYQRTRASLRLAGCRDAIMVDVVDAGVNQRLLSLPRIRHSGIDRRFVCAARLVDDKGIDLAIRAVAVAHPQTTLSIYGDGEKRSDLIDLAVGLGIEDRIIFHGWIHNDLLIERFSRYRGYVMPSLAEANGIIMQEAMMAGLPVIAFRWGGPRNLGDVASALFVAPQSENEAVTDFAAAMNQLAESGELAESLSLKAHEIALARFTWQAVASSWLGSYPVERRVGRILSDHEAED